MDRLGAGYFLMPAGLGPVYRVLNYKKIRTSEQC